MRAKEVGAGGLAGPTPPGGPQGLQDKKRSEENVALRIAWEMQRRGWSQERMAKEMTDAGCPMHQSAISKIVNVRPDGGRRAITVDEAITFARVFRMPLDELLLPPEDAEGSAINDLAIEIHEISVDAYDSLGNLIFAWVRLAKLLDNESMRERYSRWLSATRFSPERAEEVIRSWRDEGIREDFKLSFDALTRIYEAAGGNADLPPKIQSREIRARSIMRDLMTVRRIFSRNIDQISERDMNKRLKTYASALVRCGMLESAASFANTRVYGIPGGDSVQSILDQVNKKLAEIENGDSSPVEKLAARIARIWNEGPAGFDKLEELTGASREEIREATVILGPENYRGR